MSGRQGFITNGQTYVYQESSLSTSAAFGLDLGDSGRWKLSVLPTDNATPSGIPQIAIDITTPGDIEITPNTGGVLYVNNANVTAYGAKVSTVADGFEAVKSRNYLVLTSGDDLGFVKFSGFDSVNDKVGAQILSTSSGTIGVGRVAANLQFFTSPDAVSAAVQRMVISPTGVLTINALTNGVVLSSGAGVISSVDPGVAGLVLTSNGVGVAPSWQASGGGVTSLAGTANQITVSAATGAVTLSIPAIFIAPGTIASTTSLTAGNAFTVTAGTITLTPLSTSGIVVNSAAGVITTSATTNHAIQLGNSSGQLSSLAVGATNTVLLGNTAADPSFGTVGNAALTNSSVTLSSGNNITVTGGGPLSLGGTASFNLTGTTNHAIQIGNAGASLTSLTVGTNGQLLIAGTAADPSWVTPTAGSGLSITTNSTTLSYAISAPVSIANGGTNATSMATTDGTVYFDGTRLVTTATGSSGQVLTSNGAGVAPTYQAASGGVSSITGTANQITASASTGAVTLSIPAVFIAPGSIDSTTTINSGGALSSGTTTTAGTGLTVTLNDIQITSGDLVLTQTTSSTKGVVYQKLLNTDGTVTNQRVMHTYGDKNSTNVPGYNTFVGRGTGNFTMTTGTARFNTALGSGEDSGGSTVFGPLVALTTGAGNTAMGYETLGKATTGSNNTALGVQAGQSLTTGGDNILVGGGTIVAGSAYTSSESSNLIIGNAGVITESHVLRIGTNGSGTGQQSACYIAGIDAVNVGSVAKVVTMASNQLGTATITAGSNITITPGANTITIAATGGGLTWTVTTVNASLVASNGYIANKAGLLTMTLPVTAAVGAEFVITGINTAVGWRIAQNSGQTIYLGTSASTTGAGGYIEATQIRDSVRLICVVANNDFNVLSSVGNITVA